MNEKQASLFFEALSSDVRLRIFEASGIYVGKKSHLSP